MGILRKNNDDMNGEIARWSDNTRRDLIGQLDSLGVQHSDHSPNKVPLRQALKRTLRKRFDAIDRISYQMPRSAIFLHKGVSRGHGKDNPRKAKEWYAPVIDKNIDSLSAIVAEGQGNMIVNQFTI
jgi:hypothetical protein